MITTNDVLKHLKYIGAPDRKLKMDLSDHRSPELISTDYFFDIVGCGQVPIKTVRDSILQEHNVTTNDNVCSYQIDDVSEAINLLAEIADQLGFNFTEEHKIKLQQRAGKGNTFLLLIMERPIYGYK